MMPKSPQELATVLSAFNSQFLSWFGCKIFFDIESPNLRHLFFINYFFSRMFIRGSDKARKSCFSMFAIFSLNYTHKTKGKGIHVRDTYGVP